jgi:DNA-binding beta-propeller fold protein YncE
MSDGRHVAVADTENGRVSIFSVDGEFIRHVGVGVLKKPTGVTCSATGELVVADWGNDRVVVFSADGDMVLTMGGGNFTGVAVHGSTIFAQDNGGRCVVFA